MGLSTKKDDNFSAMVIKSFMGEGGGLFRVLMASGKKLFLSLSL